MFRIALCDDNGEFRKKERDIAEKYLSEQNLSFEIMEFASGEELINEDKIDTYNLILLDYEMAGINGFETAKQIRKKSEKTCIAFVTVFYELSREGYRFDAIRYLVKQEDTFEEELRDCLWKAIKVKDSAVGNSRSFNFVEGTMLIELANIVYISVKKHYLEFFIVENSDVKKYLLRETMQNLQKTIENTSMFSLARPGLLMNFKYVTLLPKGFIRVTVNEQTLKIVPLSDSKKKQFSSALMRYKGGT